MAQSPIVKRARKIIRETQPSVEQARNALSDCLRKLDEDYEFYWWAIEYLNWNADEVSEGQLLRAERRIADRLEEQAILKIVLSRVEQGLTDRE